MVPPRDLAATIPPSVIADCFVKQYYMVLKASPEISHKFYAESSQLGWQDCNGVITNVTTLSSIKDKILSSDYKNCVAEVNNVDAQATHDGGVLVSVTGTFVEKDEVKNIFLQSFILARQAKGFFILNDFLRVFPAVGSVPDDAQTVHCAPCVASDISVLEDTVAKVSSSEASEVVASAEKVPPVVEPTTNAEVAPATSAKVPSGVEPTSGSAKLSPAHHSLIPFDCDVVHV